MKALVTAFADTPFGVFSKLTIGELELYTQELPFDGDDSEQGCIDAGIYEVIRDRTSDRDEPWLIINVFARHGVVLGRAFNVDANQPNIMIGERLDSVGGKWCIADQDAAMEKLNALLQDVFTFRLYIDRTICGQNYRKNDRTV